MPSMSHSDSVREYVGAHFVEPARYRGDTEVTIRSGDVHEALGFKNRLPLVCSALGTQVFEDQYRLKRLSIEGPLNGSSTVFRFKLLS